MTVVEMLYDVTLCIKVDLISNNESGGEDRSKNAWWFFSLNFLACPELNKDSTEARVTLETDH